MELLEVRRVQEEEEKKRQAPPTEPQLVDAAPQQRSEELYQYHQYHSSKTLLGNRLWVETQVKHARVRGAGPDRLFMPVGLY